VEAVSNLKITLQTKTCKNRRNGGGDPPPKHNWPPAARVPPCVGCSFVLL